MTYYVYEDWRASPDKAVIHRFNCGHCDGGEGTNKPKEPGRNGLWHGPFATHRDALQFAEKPGRDDVHSCGHCDSG